MTKVVVNVTTGLIHPSEIVSINKWYAKASVNDGEHYTYITAGYGRTRRSAKRRAISRMRKTLKYAEERRLALKEYEPETHHEEVVIQI